MDSKRISSRDNELVKYYRRLTTSASVRIEEKRFVAEGKRLCFDLAAQKRPEIAFFTDEFAKSHPQVVNLAEENYFINKPVEDKLASTKSPQGIYCVFAMPACALQDIEIGQGVLLCEAMQDPANVGAVLRSAAAFGYGGVVLLPGSADPYAPKALRASMGTVYRLPVITGENLADVVEYLTEKDVCLYAAALEQGQPLSEMEKSAPYALLIGNEGAGLTDEALAAADKRVYIPMHKGVESLNAAVAASVLMYHFKMVP